MERGLDQLIFFAFIVLAALVDWVVRIIRNRNAPPPPPRPSADEEEAGYYHDEAEYPEQELEPEWRIAPMAEAPTYEPPVHAPERAVTPRYEASRPAPLPTPTPPPERVFDAQLPVEWRRIIEAQRVATSHGGNLPAHVPPPAGPQPSTATAQPWSRPSTASARSATPGNRWRRDVLWLKDASAARRAIVMMAVLGPCRALEDQPRRP